MIFRGMALLFVYGSLRRGSRHPMARLLEDGADWMGVSRVEGQLYLIDWYPGLVPADSAGQWVEGDLYRMCAPEHLLPLLDDFEECSTRFDHPLEYRREIVMVEQTGTVHPAWTYFYNHPVTGRQRMDTGSEDGISRFCDQYLYRARSI